MSGVRPDGPDELGLAEVAWQLRTTLADAGDVPVAGDERVLSAIRRRSTQRRRAKRVLSTSMAAFALSLSTLAVVKGGQVAIDHGIARNADPPAVTPANAPEGGHGGGAPEATTPGTQARTRKGPNDCKPDPHNGVVPCQPNGQPEDPTSTAQGGAVDPTKPSVPDGPAPSPTSTAPPTTNPPPTAAPPTQPNMLTGVTCEMITPDAEPTDPACFKRHVEANDAMVVSLLVVMVDPADSTKRIQRGWEYEPLKSTAVTVTLIDPTANRYPRYQCPLDYAGVGPEWYRMGPQCIRMPG
jgi:hypothetical protein